MTGSDFMEFDNSDIGSDDKHMDVPKTHRHISKISSPIRHYRAFSTTLKANSVVGNMEPAFPPELGVLQSPLAQFDSTPGQVSPSPPICGLLLRIAGADLEYASYDMKNNQ